MLLQCTYPMGRKAGRGDWAGIFAYVKIRTMAKWLAQNWGWQPSWFVPLSSPSTSSSSFKSKLMDSQPHRVGEAECGELGLWRMALGNWSWVCQKHRLQNSIIWIRPIVALNSAIALIESRNYSFTPKHSDHGSADQLGLTAFNG